MLRSIWKSIVVLTVGVLLALVAGVPPESPAAAQGTSAELMERLDSDGLTREQLAELYRSLVVDQFQPPACVAGAEMFTDVPASSPFCSWIEELARRGITGGCTATEYCPGNPVNRAQMAVFIVSVVADEAPHIVGAPGEPAFGNGGEGDCLWQNPPPDTDFLAAANPVSFYKDSHGIVRLAGLPVPFDGPGGDMTCDSNTDPSDLLIFQLPNGYQPSHLEVFSSANPSIGINLIVPQGGVMFDGNFIPGGTVMVASVENGNATTLDGITFRAAPAAAAISSHSREPASISLQALRDLLN